MTPTHWLTLVLHVSAGVCGLGLGLVPVFTRKGGATHRRFGRLFVMVAIPVIATAVISDLLYHPTMALVAVTLAAGYQLIGGLRSLVLKRRGPQFIDAVLACAVLGLCLYLFKQMGPGTASFNPAIGYSTIGYIGLVALYDLSRHFWADAWRTRARFLDHGLKLTGTYFAMMSAGFGNVFRSLQPWSQVVPSALGILAMIVLAVLYLRGSPERLDFEPTFRRAD